MCLTCSCVMLTLLRLYFFFFFNDTATTEIYTLSLHDALPICLLHALGKGPEIFTQLLLERRDQPLGQDRKSTRLNSSHTVISYAVFCLKKKKEHINRPIQQNTNKEVLTMSRSECDRDDATSAV